MAQIPGKKLCNLCEEKDGCFFCHQCKKALCKPCRKAHEKIQQTKSHSFSDLNQIDLSAYRSVAECISHKDVYVLFCKECKSLICTKCITDNHKGHEFSQIKDIVKEFRTIAEKDILEIKDKLKSLSALITRIENVHIPALQEKAQKVKCDITSLTKEVESQIKTRKQIYISDVENREELGKDELKAALSNHKRTYKNATDVCTHMESLMLEKCDITFYLAFKNLEKSCYKCIDEPEGVETPKVYSFNKESFLEDIVNDLEKKFDQRLSSLKRDLQQKDDIITGLVVEKDTLENKIEETQKSLLSCERDLQQKQDDIIKLVKEKDDLENNFTESQESLLDCERDLIQKQKDIKILVKEKDHLENRLKEEEERLRNCERDLQEKQKDINFLKKKKNDLENKIKESEKRQRSQEEEILYKADIIRKLTTEKTDIHNSFRSCERDLQQKQDNIIILVKKTKDLETKIKESEKRQRLKEEEIQQKADIITKLNAEKTDFNNSLINLKQEKQDSMSRFTREKTTLEGIIEESYERQSSLKQDLHQRDEIIEKLTTEKEALQERFLEIDTAYKRSQMQMDFFTKAYEIEKGPPAVYRLPITENLAARNESAKTRKFYLGKRRNDTIERTIMIVGEKSSGKITLINGMTNYIMGVSWEDPFRFSLISEQGRNVDLGQSQTEWVTSYTNYNNVSDRLNYTVNLIDITGFGDVRGLEQDAKIEEQIRQLFTAKGEQGVATLDALCFVLQPPCDRLTTNQRYIFESILSLFGNDIRDNICTLITFADVQRPPVLAEIEALVNIPSPQKKYFAFNNGALFSDNTNQSPKKLSPLFRNMDIQSYNNFFCHVSTLRQKNLIITIEVLNIRQQLETEILSLHQEINLGLPKISQLEQETKLLKNHAKAISENKNFEYEVEEMFPERVPLRKGLFTLHCLICNFSCLKNCEYDGNQKAHCSVMNKDGKCTACPERCSWTQHHSLPFTIEWSTRKVKKKYVEMEEKYKEAKRRIPIHQQLFKKINEDVMKTEQNIDVMMEVISQLNNQLKEKALCPNPLSTVQQIDLMIKIEKREKKTGFQARIDALCKCKQRAQYTQNVQIFKDRLRDTRRAMDSLGVATEAIQDER